MTDTANERRWGIYIHTAPSNKHYIGIFSGKNPNKRWANGLGYRTQTVFFRAIIKYGWDNISHKIVSTGLTFEEACKMEQDLIERYKTNVSKYHRDANGYNMTDGGDRVPSIFYQEDEEYKRKMEEKVYSKTRISVDVYDRNFIFIGTYKSLHDAETELKIDASSIGIAMKCYYGKNSRHNSCLAGGYIFINHGDKLNKEQLLSRHKAFQRPVYQIDISNGKIVGEYISCAEASRSINDGNRNGSSIIAKVCKGQRESYKGYKWKYATKI